MRGGVLGAAGFNAETARFGAKANTQYWSLAGVVGVERGLKGTKFVEDMAGHGFHPHWMTTAGLGGQLLGTSMSVLQGVKENGLRGGYDAMVWEVAQQAAVGHFSFASAATKAGVKSGALEAIGGMRWMGLSLGATTGASIGQAIGGTPGAFVGAFLGATATTPQGAMIAAVGMGYAAAIAAPAIGLGAAYKVGQAGVRYRRNQRNINTSGDMSAFMTQNSMTMRSRAIQSIARSQTNARSALGQEANYMSMNRNYFSPYRQV